MEEALSPWTLAAGAPEPLRGLCAPGPSRGSRTRLGLYYTPPDPSRPMQNVDPDHVLHNNMTKIIWGQGEVDPNLCAISCKTPRRRRERA